MHAPSFIWQEFKKKKSLKGPQHSQASLWFSYSRKRRSTTTELPWFRASGGSRGCPSSAMWPSLIRFPWLWVDRASLLPLRTWPVVVQIGLWKDRGLISLSDHCAGRSPQPWHHVAFGEGPRQWGTRGCPLPWVSLKAGPHSPRKIRLQS